MSHAPNPVPLHVFDRSLRGCSYGIMDVRQLSDAMCFVKVFDPWGVLQVPRLPRFGVQGVFVTRLLPQWRGPWSATSQLWDMHIAVTRALGMVMNSRMQW